MPMYVHVRGKVQAVCTESWCGWKSGKFPDMSGAHLALAHHNFEDHPGVFPRWNPNFVAAETKRKGAINYGNEEDEEGLSTSPEKQD